MDGIGWYRLDWAGQELMTRGPAEIYRTYTFILSVMYDMIGMGVIAAALSFPFLFLLQELL